MMFRGPILVCSTMYTVQLCTHALYLLCTIIIGYARLADLCWGRAVLFGLSAAAAAVAVVCVVSHRQPAMCVCARKE